MRLFSITLAVFVLSWPTLSSAAVEPDNVAAEVKSAAKICRDLSGKPDTEAMLTVNDLNGDGAEDWIVDYSKLKCVGVSNPFCGSGGCSLQIFLWQSGAKWRLAFDEVLHSYKIIATDGKRVLQVQFGGAACNRTNASKCVKRYHIQKTGIVAID